jgi:hypothetical protein
MLYACEIQMLDMKISIALSEREATPSGQTDLGGRHNPVGTEETASSRSSVKGCSIIRATEVATIGNCGATAGAERHA